MNLSQYNWHTIEMKRTRNGKRIQKEFPRLVQEILALLSTMSGDESLPEKQALLKAAQLLYEVQLHYTKQ